MNYLVIGTVSSEQELQQVLANTRAVIANKRRVEEFVEFLNMMEETEKSGVATEAKRWKHVAEDSTVKLYYSKPKTGQSGIWAAIMVAANQKDLTVLKIVDTFAGGDHEHEGLLADALYRKAKGTITQGQVI